MNHIRVATLDDLNSIKKLHARYQLQTVNEADKKDGFVTTAFTDEQWHHVIVKEKSMCIAVENGNVIGYAIAASWQFFSAWPLFAQMINHLSEKTIRGEMLTSDNSYQYGPICVASEHRSSGLFEQLFEYSRVLMSQRYPYMVTFINKKNPRSFAAHDRKTSLAVISEFEFNEQHFYELGMPTKDS